MSADRVFVETVKDGVISSVDVSREQLTKEKFKAKITKDKSRPNGTMVKLTFPRKMTSSDGKVTNFQTKGKSFHDIIFHKIKYKEFGGCDRQIMSYNC
jgi:hypothetical protein